MIVATGNNSLSGLVGVVSVLLCCGVVVPVRATEDEAQNKTPIEGGIAIQNLQEDVLRWGKRAVYAGCLEKTRGMVCELSQSSAVQRRDADGEMLANKGKR
jgi:hypothetical protein